jgi:hypothetical protein
LLCNDPGVSPAADRRFELIYLVCVYNSWRMGNRQTRRWAQGVLVAGLSRAGSEWTGALDIAWFATELTKVKAEPGEYLPGSYERWRRHGLPIWAACAAGLYPLPRDDHGSARHAATISVVATVGRPGRSFQH